MIHILEILTKRNKGEAFTIKFKILLICIFLLR